jgi:hypothetical protein
MSIEAISWALNKAPIPRDPRDSSSLTIVLVALANHADPDGRNAFPSVATLTRYTRLSERSVRNALRSLESLGLIRPSDPEIVAAYVKRSDRRPNGYDLALELVEVAVDSPGDLVDRSTREGQSLPPADQHGGQTAQPRGANNDRTGGRACPRNVLNHPRNRPAPSAPDGRSTPPPVCGQCDARDTDPVSARVVWLDTERSRSNPCPRCHPNATRTETTR